MTLQNRVDPFGKLHAVSAYGDWMGNRGCLHNERREIVSERWTTTAWITCVATTAGPRRQLMRPGWYTELFFLDEATALAAGHRPCAQCRRADYKRFRQAFADGNHLSDRLRSADLDRQVHADRTGPRRTADARDLPNGAMFAQGGRPYLKVREGARTWSFQGYGPLQVLPNAPVAVLTPASIVAALGAGYACQIRCR